MTQRVLCVIAMLTAASCSTTEPEDSPRVGYPYKYPGHILTPAEIHDIVAFTQTVSGIDQHVLTISVKTPSDVEVETGRGPTAWGPEYRDMIRIQKRHARWSVTQKEQLKVLTFP
jgi:hypothetical protein